MLLQVLCRCHTPPRSPCASRRWKFSSRWQPCHKRREVRCRDCAPRCNPAMVVGRSRLAEQNKWLQKQACCSTPRRHWATSNRCYIMSSSSGGMSPSEILWGLYPRLPSFGRRDQTSWSVWYLPNSASIAAGIVLLARARNGTHRAPLHPHSRRRPARKCRCHASYNGWSIWDFLAWERLLYSESMSSLL